MPNITTNHAITYTNSIMYVLQGNQFGLFTTQRVIQCIALSTFQTTGLGSDGWEGGGVGKEY